MIDLDPEAVSDIKPTDNDELNEMIEPSKEAARKFRRAFKEGRLTLEENGHDTHYGWQPGHLLDTFAFWFYNSPAALKPVVDALDNPLDMPFDRREWFRLRDDTTCNKCGGKIQFYTNGRVIKAVEFEHKTGDMTGLEPGTPEYRRAWFGEILCHDRPCIFAAGVPIPSYEIDVPSGFLVLGNNFHLDFFTDPVVWGEDKNKSLEYTHEYSINHYAGKMKYMEHHAQLGLLTGFMGSGGTDVYISPTSVILGKGALVDPENDEDTTVDTIIMDEEGKVGNVGVPHSLMASISFGLWWYGAADLGRLKELNPEKAAEIKHVKKSKHPWPTSYSGEELFYIPVVKGRWRMTHYGREHRDPSFDVEAGEHGHRIMSRLQLVRAE